MTPADAAIQAATPCVMVPRYGALPVPAVGSVRYLAAEDGVYIEARSQALDVCLRLAEVSPPLPYGPVIERVELDAGLIPVALLEECERLARAAMPNEWAGVIVRDGDGYRLWVPPESEASVHRVSYAAPPFDPLDIVVDIHSHNTMPAFFSETDDEDDRSFPGPCVFSMVLGDLHRTAASCVCRIVVNSRLHEIATLPFG